MRDQLHINDQTFFVVRVAASKVSYSKDYITRLAREKKIRAVHISRQWYVDLDTLKQYEQIQIMETTARNRQLKLQRKIELGLREKVTNNTLLYTNRNATLFVSSFMVVAIVVSVGFVSGAQLNKMLPAAVFLSHQHVTPVSTGSQDAITPAFTTIEDRAIFVANNRSIPSPETEHNWLRIRYE